MNEQRAFEHEIRASFDEHAPMSAPNHLLHTFEYNAQRTRRYPRWLVLIKEPTMRTDSRLAVGSPTARLAAVVIATMLLAAGVIGASFAGAQLSAADGTIVVDAAGDGDYTTIQEAVAAAQEGDEILVKPGTYAEAILIDKDITLRGDGQREEIILEYGEDGPTIPSWSGQAPYGLMLVDTEAIVSDLTVRGPNAGVAFVLVGGAPTFERVANEHEGEFSGRVQLSVAPLHGAGAIIRDSSLSGPVWEGDAGSLPQYEGITGPGRWVIEDNISDSGLWLGGIADGSMILRNTISADIELHLQGGGTLLVANNDTSAIELDEPSGDGVTIRDNVLHGTVDDSAAIVLGSGSPIVEGNVITDAKTGILVPEGASPMIIGNQLEGLQVAISVFGVESHAVIEDNRFCRNERDLSVAEGSSLTLDPSNEVCADAASE